MQDVASTSAATIKLTALQQFWLVIAALTAVMFALFSIFPQIDIAFSSAFTDGRTFPEHNATFVTSMRTMFNWIFLAVCVLAVVGMIATRTWSRSWLKLSFAQWLFLTACIITGPGLVVNLGLKDHWDRARPSTVVEFGGERTFTPIQTPGTQCLHNCSFVCGEAASMFMVFFAAAFMLPAWSLQFWVAGTIVGFLAGLIRIIQGDHFLSDVVFAGLFMAMTAGLLDYTFRAIYETGPHARDEDHV